MQGARLLKRRLHVLIHVLACAQHHRLDYGLLSRTIVKIKGHGRRQPVPRPHRQTLERELRRRFKKYQLLHSELAGHALTIQPLYPVKFPGVPGRRRG